MSDQKPAKKKNTLIKELREWGIMLGIFAILYYSGLYTQIAGKLQQGLLWTGIIQPEMPADAQNARIADFDMPLLTLSGEQTSLKEFKGKAIFLNFWATWCPPCIAEMPNIQDLYARIDHDKVAFVMVSLDEEIGKAEKFIQNKNYTLPVYFMSGRRPSSYNSSVVPTTYIISSEGKIVSEKTGMAHYNSDEFKNFIESL